MTTEREDIELEFLADEYTYAGILDLEYWATAHLCSLHRMIDSELQRRAWRCEDSDGAN